MGAFRGFATSFPGAVSGGVILSADVTLTASTNVELTTLRQALVVRDSGVYLLVAVGQLLVTLGATPPGSLVATIQGGTVAGGSQLGTATAAQLAAVQLAANNTWNMPLYGVIALNAIAGQTVNCSIIVNSNAQNSTARQTASGIAWLLTRQQD